MADVLLVKNEDGEWEEVPFFVAEGGGEDTGGDAGTFYAIQGQTTWNEVMEAVSAGKSVIARSNNTFYTLTNYDSSLIRFSRAYQSGTYHITLSKEDKWAAGSTTHAKSNHTHDNYIDQDDLQSAIDTALEQAKASGEFDGADGKDGAAGYTPQKGVDYFDGKDGEDGYTPVKGVDYFDGQDGEDGVTPIKGTDYFTEEDKTELANDVFGLMADSGDILQFRGTDPISNIEDDTPTYWRSLGRGIWEITGAGYSNINNGINCFMGQIISLPRESHIVQLWLTPISNNIYSRSAGVNDSWTNTWTPLRYNKSEIVQDVLNALQDGDGVSY